MRLQNLIIIFIIIALPVILVLSFYVGYQVDAATLMASYDSKILGATYDTLLAFQLNTTNNKYSTVSDSLVRDIEASITVFSTTLASSLGITGTSSTGILSYVPAILFTLYDGYYIYTPTVQTDGTYEHELKPYVYYTKEYESQNGNSKITINYSLDNYVVVYYYYNNGAEYTSKAGYLEAIDKGDGVWVSGDEVYYKGVKIDQNETITQRTATYNSSTKTTSYSTGDSTSTSAYEYYKEAYDFTEWFNEVIKTVNPVDEENNSLVNKLTINLDNQALPDVGSYFNDEKTNVIKDSIKDNLIQAMETYKRKSGIDFSMPEFTEDDWENIIHNVCVVSFVQGLIAGTTTYNNYVILPSTENEQYVNESSIYYVGTDGYYHRIGCPYLEGEGNEIVGYNKTEFSVQTVITSDGETAENANGETMYYYMHDEKACYYCIVNASDASLDSIQNYTYSGKSADDDSRILAYYRALAREKYDLVKASSYVNGSSTQYE